MQYFFNLRSSARLIVDAEGADFPSQQAARIEAVSVARELIGRRLIADEEVDWTAVVEVVCDGQVVETIGFMEAAGVPETRGS